MTSMGIQDRYDDISALSGLSEDIIRRVFKATRQSVTKSIKKGEKATVPGLVTFYPEMRSRLNSGGTSMSQYIKIKSTVSSALETELAKLGEFEKEQEYDNTSGLEKLCFMSPQFPDYTKDGIRVNNNNGIRTNQISALL